MLPLVCVIAAVAGPPFAIGINRMLNGCYRIDDSELDELDNLVGALDVQDEDGLDDSYPYEATTLSGERWLYNEESPCIQQQGSTTYSITVDSDTTTEHYEATLDQAIQTVENSPEFHSSLQAYCEGNAPPPPAPPAGLVGRQLSDEVARGNANRFAARAININTGQEQAFTLVCDVPRCGAFTKAHFKRRRRFRKAPFTRFLVASARAKFAAVGPPTPSDANVRAVQLFVRRIMDDRKVRPVHQNLVMPTVIRMVMSPTTDMLQARRLDMSDRLAKRRHEYSYQPTYTLYIQLRNFVTGRNTAPPSYSA
jgi:hypothetical protein